MATIASKFSTRHLNVVNGDCAGDVVVNNYYYDAAVGDLVLNNVIDIGILPDNHTVVDAVLLPDQLDSNVSPTITLDVGIMSGTPGDTVSARTCDTTIFAASTAGQAGVAARATQASAFRIQPNQGHRSIGVIIHAAPATAKAGRIRLQVMTAPADPTIAF